MTSGWGGMHACLFLTLAAPSLNLPGPTRVGTYSHYERAHNTVSVDALAISYVKLLTDGLAPNRLKPKRKQR